MIVPADLSLDPLVLSRQGYDGAGAATTVSNTIYLTKRVRLPYPDQATLTTGPVAGAGGGVYTLQGGSPALAMVADSPVPYDLAGNARSGTVAAGAYL